MAILKMFSLKNLKSKLISASIFASKVLIVWYLFNLGTQVYLYFFTEAGRNALTTSDQSTQLGYIFNFLSAVVLNGVQALVFYGYSQIATWILKIQKGESAPEKKEEVTISEKNNKSEKSDKKKDKKKN